MPRRCAPIWLMGLTNAVFGMYGGIVVISMPQLLSARHVPEGTIAAMTAVMLSPGFWAFLVSPVLDVRFSRRWYSMATALAAAALLVCALLNLDNLALLEILMVCGFFLANLYQSALGGWLSSITPAGQQGRLSAWMTIGNLSGGGAGVFVGGISGCLGYRLIEPLLSKRLLYLAIGMAGAVLTLALLALARTPLTFALALIGENAFQALAFTASTAIAFETIGRDNPLAATTFCLMISASNIPLMYMLFADSWGYARFGVPGSLAVDAALSLLAATLLMGLLAAVERRNPAPG